MRAYIADTKQEQETGQINVIDLPSGKRLGSIDTLYNPDVAVSPDGSQLFVVQTDLRKSPDEAQDQLVVYDTGTFKLTYTVNFRNRTLYNVAPTSNGLVVSPDGRFLYVAKTETLGDDKARHSIGILDTKSGEFRKQELDLRYSALNFGILGESPRLHFALTGRSGEAIGYSDAGRARGIARLQEFTVEDQRESPFFVAASAAHPAGRLLYVVARDGTLRILELERNSLSEPISLTVPIGMAIPLQHLLVSESQALVGLGREELSARGQSEEVYIYDIDGGIFFRRRSIGLSPPCEKIYLSPDGTQLIGLSREWRSLQMRDIASAKINAIVKNIGESPVSLALAPGSNK
ncbi:MAG TPA: amine dehydrogenase large subunit [Pyrinomonadaceae bacterium]